MIANMDFKVDHKLTISQPLKHYDSIIEYLEDGVEVNAIYLDFAKAFDKVDHTVLLKKLEALRINRKVRVWIESFLIRHNQIVKVEGS